MTEADQTIVQSINAATERLPWFPGLQLKPYQVRLWNFLASVPEGYRPEFTRGRGRVWWIARHKDGTEPILWLRNGEWKPLNPSSPPTGSPAARPPAAV
jgi:hypothetical protein